MSNASEKEEGKHKNTRVIHTWWLSATALVLVFFACVVALCCLVNTNVLLHIILLFCARPIAGCSAVLAVGRYYGCRSLVCVSTSWCAQKKQVITNKIAKKREKNCREIDPEKMLSPSAIRS